MMERKWTWLVLLAAGVTLVACGPGASAPDTAAVEAEEEIAPTTAPTAEAQDAQVEESAESEQPPVADMAPVQCDGQATPAQTEGPYYTPDTPERASLIEEGTVGTPLIVTGHVLDTDCQPIAGAKVDFWQTDGAGEYDNVGYKMRGHQFTDADGAYRLETVIPGEYPGRTPHIHVKVFGPDGSEWLTTQLYLAGISDQVPDGIYNAALLTRDLEPDAEGRKQVAFDFVVQG